MKPKDVKNNNLTKYTEEFNKKDPKFKVGDYVRISKYKNIFSKSYLSDQKKFLLLVK